MRKVAGTDGRMFDISLAEVPLYYTGLSDTSTITFEGDRSTSKLVKLDRMFNVYLNICECNSDFQNLIGSPLLLF